MINEAVLPFVNVVVALGLGISACVYRKCLGSLISMYGKKMCQIPFLGMQRFEKYYDETGSRRYVLLFGIGMIILGIIGIISWGVALLASGT